MMMKRSILVWSIVGIAAFGTLAYAARIAWRSYRTEGATFIARRWSVPRPPSSVLSGAIDISLPTHFGPIAGWYLPSSNRAAVVLLHGSSADRSSMLADALLLQRAGFGVLMYDSPGHGESAGTIEWGHNERTALRAAVDYLSTRDDVDPKSIGALGFSMGGFLVAVAAPDEPRLKAVVIEGSPTDVRQHLRLEYHEHGWLSYLPAEYAVQRRGLALDGPMPVTTIGRIAPRPVLIVAGGDDQHVPLTMAHELYAAAREPKSLLVVAGAGHGAFFDAPGSTYGADVVSFFTRSLLDAR